MTIDELKSRLDNEFSDIYKCVLIKGEWGIGKTYFLRKKYLCDKKHISILIIHLIKFNKSVTYCIYGYYRRYFHKYIRIVLCQESSYSR